MGDLDRIKKTDIQIIERLIRDTSNNKIHWYEDSFENVFYARTLTLSKDQKTKVFLKFEISTIDDTDDNFAVEFSEVYYGEVLQLNILMKKNSNKEIECRKITEYQHELSELTNLVLKNLKVK